MLHDIFAGGVDAQRDRGQRVRRKVDEQDVHRLDGHFGQPDADGDEQNEDLGDIARDEELDDLLDIAVHPAPLADGALDGRKVVVQKDHIRRVLGNVRTRDAHGDADVRLFKGGRVVHAVARHGGDGAVRADGADDAQLIRGGHAREHDALFDRLFQLVVAHRVELGARNDGVSLAEDMQFARDRHGGDLVVARDHDDADPRRVAGVHRADDLLAGRVDHARHADEGEPLFDVRALLFGHGGDLAHGKAEHAQRLLAHAPDEREHLRAVLLRHLTHARSGADMRAQRQHLVHGALRVDHVPAAHVVDDAHALAVGVEGLLEQPLVLFFVFLGVDAERLREEHQRPLRRVA